MKITFEAAIRKSLLALGIEPPTLIGIEIPKHESFGDLSTPVAMGLAKTLKKSPRDIATAIIRHIDKGTIFEKIEIAGPGFINAAFTIEFLQKSLDSLIREGSAFLRQDIGAGKKIQIEFVSANPTGPLHLGHGRGAAVGGALSRLLSAAGFDVEREYYINDAGQQIRLLGHSVFAQYKKVVGITYPFPDEGYRGDYVADIARTVIDAIGNRYKDSSYEEAGQYFEVFSLKQMLEAIKRDLVEFGVDFDIWQSERELYESGAVTHAIDFLKEKGYLYDSEGALWFRATDFGDEKDRVVIKSDGQPTYFASDIAYHLKKVEKGFDEIINIWGADHHGYVPRLEAVIDALGFDRKKLKVLLVQMVSLQRGGKPVQMSKRAGEFVTLKEVSDEVGADTTKFIFLTRRHDSHLSFDLEAAKAESAENPVYYVQYANARINSVFKHARESGIDLEKIREFDLTPLDTPDELRMVKKLLSYPITFEIAAQNREPHHITFYLQELAGTFHSYYNKYRVVSDDAPLTLARLALCEAVRAVLKEGLEILGITAPERM